jgi:hypothetical protein
LRRSPYRSGSVLSSGQRWAALRVMEAGSLLTAQWNLLMEQVTLDDAKIESIEINHDCGSTL